MRSVRLGITVVLLASALAGVTGGRGVASEGPAEFVLSPEGNHLWAYDTTSGDQQLLARAQNGEDPGATAPNGLVRDINGQVCTSPDQKHVVTGEDTVIPATGPGGGDGGSSHDPRIAGWGYFRITGDELGSLAIEQRGKLAPEAGEGPGYAGDPDNYGCGFLDDRRLLTTAIGNTLPGEEANGQLFLWFGPFDTGFRTETDPESGSGFYVGEVDHCEVDATLATAGGIAVDTNGDVYVATNRPTEVPGGEPGAVWRFSGRWPSSLAECTPEYLAENITKTQIVPSIPGLPVDARAPTPSAVVLSPVGTLYVSSVFSGTVSEYRKDGTWLRDLYPLSPVTPPTGPTTQTPFGMAVTADGSLWMADLGIAVASPAPGEGSVIRLSFDDDGDPRLPAETVRDGLTFPDGLGVYRPAQPREPGGPEVSATSQLACPAWSMYGATLGRTFSNGCASGIDRGTVASLVPAWTIDTAKPVTATPAVADGVLYVGSWEGIMYAIDADTGAIRWRHQSPLAPGATYGPIVSSAAISDVRSRGNDVRRLVIFGSGPRVVALDATDGAEVWVHDASNGVVDTPTQYESSPVVVGDLVLVGRDTHNEGVELTGGVRGGLVALDVETGEVRWVFEPELDAPGAGCGGMWSSPTVDPVNDLVFMGTANCPVDGYEWTPHVNAITAVDLRSGAPVWSFQPSGPPDDDTDFGATPNLFVDRTGRPVLGAGKKDGTYYALDPTTGRQLWRTHVADPAPNIGGFIGSPAVYEGNVFGGTALGTPPFFHSLDGSTGNVRFQGGVGPTYGATAVVNGVAFNAALDDLLKAYDTDSGRLLWAAPLAGPGSSGPAIYRDMVFVGSGTSTSDACAKDNPFDEACVFAFDAVLATLGGIHAYRLAGAASPTLPGLVPR